MHSWLVDASIEYYASPECVPNKPAGEGSDGDQQQVRESGDRRRGSAATQTQPRSMDIRTANEFKPSRVQSVHLIRYIRMPGG